MSEQLESLISKLKAEHQRILVAQCQDYAETDAEAALNKTRKPLEAICDQIVTTEKLRFDQDRSKVRLEQLITTIHAAGLLPKEIHQAFRTIQGFGNFGSHNTGGADVTIISSVAKSSLFGGPSLSLLPAHLVRLLSQHDQCSDQRTTVLLSGSAAPILGAAGVFAAAV